MMSAMFERGGAPVTTLPTRDLEAPGRERREKRKKAERQREIEVAPAPASEADS